MHATLRIQAQRQSTPFGLLLAGLCLATSASAATITSITPRNARLDAVQTFTVLGTALSTLAIPDCAPLARPADAPADTATRVTLRCLPLISGAKTVSVAGAPVAGALVVLDHPARSGSAAARGLPQINGVSLWNGNFNLQAADMAVRGKGPAFVLGRSYNSYYFDLEAARGAVDNYKPWRFNWDLRIGYVTTQGITANSQIFVQQADGSSRSFHQHIDGVWYALDQGNFDKLVLGASTATVYGRDGLTTTWELPAAGGRLLAVSDAHGQKLLLAYGANGKVASVKDSNGLPYTFTYDLNNQGPRVIKVADLLGRSVEYTWECGAGNSLHACGANEVQERLKTVKDLRGQITTYQYTYYPPAQDLSARTFLTAVIDPRQNPVLQLTHGAQAYGNWGVASVANGEGNTWRLAYCAEDSNGACGSTDQAVRFKTTVTPPLGPVRLSYFDTSGRPSGSIDGRNNTSKAQSTDTATLGATTYNRAALPVQHQSPLAVAGSYANAAYTHDERGLLTTLKDAANNPHQTGWAAADAARNLFCPASRTTPEGLTSTSTRDEFCRVKAQAQPGHAATSMAYAKVGMPNRPTTVAGPRQDNTQLDYDPPGNLNKVVGPMAETTSATYDRQGRAITQTNALGGITRTEYEGITSLATKVTDPLNRITVNTYDASGNLATRTAANGQLTTYVYDKANRLVETRSTVAVPGGSQTISNKTVYDALGRVQQTINANSHASTSTFDDAGNVLARANPLSQATSYQYDADNRVTQVTDPAGRITSTSYDKLGRISSASTPAGSQSYDYDNDGRVTRHVDARSNATRYRYHPSTGHLIEVTDARNQITSAEYDEAGNVVAITDPKRNTTRFEFDRSNRRSKRTDPNGHVWTWDYDKAGNVTKATAPGGLVTEYVFDTASQIKQTRLPDGQVIAHTYDANGNRLTMADATGSTSYAYDGINRLTQITDPRGKVLKYSYDAAGNRTAITYPHGKQVAYGFDAAERLTSVTDWLGKTHRYTLNAAGQVTQLALGNGTQAKMVYDAASRLQSLANTGPANAVISSHALQIDPEGNITEAAVQLPLLPSFASSTKTMAYDVANRLTAVDGAPVVHDDAGRLTAIAGEGYGYDARDLLTTITGPNAGSYTYNGAGHRVSRTVGTTTTRYVIDPNAALFNVLAETDGTGTLQRSYIHGYGLLMQISAADVPRYYHYDPTGHTLALTDAAGAVTDKYAYTPYGDTTSSGSTVNPFRFVGKFGVADEGNGLHYMRARYSKLSIFSLMTLDAVERSFKLPQNLNRYSMTDGNPVKLVDPSGREGVLAYLLDHITDFSETTFDILKRPAEAFGAKYIGYLIGASKVFSGVAASDYSKAAKDAKGVASGVAGTIVCIALKEYPVTALACGLGVEQYLNESRQPTRDELYLNGDTTETDSTRQEYIELDSIRQTRAAQLEILKANMSQMCGAALNTQTYDCAFAKQTYFDRLYSSQQN